MPSEPGLTFEEETHTYKLDGVKIPSVTQVLGDLGFIDSRWFTEESRQRGTLTHRLTELHDLGTLDASSIDPRLEGFLSAWQAFCKTSGIVWVDIEKRLHHPHLNFAGSFDRLGIDGKGQQLLIDIKTGPPAEWHKWQLAAYALMVDGGSVTSTIRRVGVHLKEDGQFRVETYTDIQDYADWLAILRVFKLSKKGEK